MSVYEYEELHTPTVMIFEPRGDGSFYQETKLREDVSMYYYRYWRTLNGSTDQYIRADYYHMFLALGEE